MVFWFFFMDLWIFDAISYIYITKINKTFFILVIFYLNLLYILIYLKKSINP